MNANEMLDFYVSNMLDPDTLADNGMLSSYSEGWLEIAEKLAVIVHAQAAVRQAEALEKLAGCVVPLRDGETAINTFDNSRHS